LWHLNREVLPAGEWVTPFCGVEFNQEIEGIRMNGISVLANDGAYRAVPCHGAVIEGGPCAEASSQTIRVIHVQL